MIIILTILILKILFKKATPKCDLGLVHHLKSNYTLFSKFNYFNFFHSQFFICFKSVVTCMDILAKSSTDEGSLSCIVVGAESKDVYILDPEAFTILGKVILYKCDEFIFIFI